MTTQPTFRRFLNDISHFFLRTVRGTLEIRRWSPWWKAYAETFAVNFPLTALLSRVWLPSLLLTVPYTFLRITYYWWCDNNEEKAFSS